MSLMFMLALHIGSAAEAHACHIRESRLPAVGVRCVLWRRRAVAAADRWACARHPY